MQAREPHHTLCRVLLVKARRQASPDSGMENWTPTPVG